MENETSDALFDICMISPSTKCAMTLDSSSTTSKFPMRDNARLRGVKHVRQRRENQLPGARKQKVTSQNGCLGAVGGVEGRNAPAHGAVINHIVVNQRRNVDNFSDLGKACLQQEEHREMRAESSSSSIGKRLHYSPAPRKEPRCSVWPNLRDTQPGGGSACQAA